MIFDDEAIEIAANLLYDEEINWKESLRLTNKILNSALASMKARGIRIVVVPKGYIYQLAKEDELETRMMITKVPEDEK